MKPCGTELHCVHPGCAVTTMLPIMIAVNHRADGIRLHQAKDEDSCRKFAHAIWHVPVIPVLQLCLAAACLFCMCACPSRMLLQVSRDSVACWGCAAVSALTVTSFCTMPYTCQTLHISAPITAMELAVMVCIANWTRAQTCVR